MELADGISVENLLKRGQDRALQPPQLLELLNTRLNATQARGGTCMPAAD
jgi:hypothetical protein